MRRKHPINEWVVALFLLSNGQQVFSSHFSNDQFNVSEPVEKIGGASDHVLAGLLLFGVCQNCGLSPIGSTSVWFFLSGISLTNSDPFRRPKRPELIGVNACAEDSIYGAEK